MDELREPRPPEADIPITLDEAIATLQMWAHRERETGRGTITMSVDDAYRIVCLAIERERKKSTLPLLTKPHAGR